MTYFLRRSISTMFYHLQRHVCQTTDYRNCLPEAPSVSVLPNTTTVIDGNSLNVTCNAFGKPKASIKWTMVNYSEVLSTDSRLTVNVSRPGTADNMIQYQCTASNGVGTSATATVNVTVHCE